MAEWMEVMNRLDRMCRHYQRKHECPMGCPMSGVNISQCRKIAFERPKETEEIVVQWAAEHLEPVYPTWTEYFRAIGIFPKWSGHEILDHTHIPADIAEKLGIEPKEE